MICSAICLILDSMQYSWNIIWEARHRLIAHPFGDPQSLQQHLALTRNTWHFRTGSAVQPHTRPRCWSSFWYHNLHDGSSILSDLCVSDFISRGKLVNQRYLFSFPTVGYRQMTTVYHAIAETSENESLQFLIYLQDINNSTCSWNNLTFTAVEETSSIKTATKTYCSPALPRILVLHMPKILFERKMTSASQRGLESQTTHWQSLSRISHTRLVSEIWVHRTPSGLWLYSF